MEQTSEFDVRRGELRQVEQSTARSLSEFRLLFAACCLAIILLHDFSATTKWPMLVLFAYCAYGISALARARNGLIDKDSRAAHWVDAACYLAVHGLTHGEIMAVGIFLLFPVLVASFHSGWQRGVRVAGVSALFVAFIGVLRVWLSSGAEPLTPSLYLAALVFGGGFVIASWSNTEFALRRHLAILDDLNSLANPAKGLESALCESAEMLRSYLHADSFIVVTSDADSGGYLFCAAGARRTAQPMRVKRIDADLVSPLFATTPELIFLFSRAQRFWQRTIARAYDRTMTARPAMSRELEEIANTLETDSFVALALHGKRSAVGRIYTTSPRDRLLSINLAVLQQVVSHAALLIENVELLERLATEAATHERRKISGDLHDGTIQPYIGLKMALDALRLKIPRDSAVAADVDELAKMTSDGIDELRRYVSALREKEDLKRTSESLVVVVRREAANFSRYAEIDVQVVASTDMLLNGPMRHEVSSIVKEGLSNIRRHTASKHAVIYLSRTEEHLILQFVNDADESSATTVFSPTSLKERAAQLGGSVGVEQHGDGRTSVAVAIAVY